MKSSAYQDTRILIEEKEDGTSSPWGVILAGDYTAEHEMGISGILRSLGIDPDGIMIEGRSMAKGGREIKAITGSKTETHHITEKSKDNSRKMTRKKAVSKPLALTNYDYYEDLKYVMQIASRYDFEKEVTGAWDKSSFVVVGWTKEAKKFLEDLKAAFRSGDVTVWIGGAGDNPFARGGLIFAITSRIPEEGKKHLNEKDDNARKLKEAVNKTKIKQILIDALKAGKILGNGWMSEPWHALKAQWTTEEDNSKYPVKFFLNPANQTAYTYGWFTVEDLKLWAKGKGPVIKNKEEKDAA